MTINTDRYRAILAAGDDLTLADCHDLLDEIDRLRAVIRETCGPTECEVSLNHHGIHCKLYEIEP